MYLYSVVLVSVEGQLCVRY